MQHDGTRAAMGFAGLSSYETWMHYCNMGGCADYFELDAYLHGLAPLNSHDADLVSQAVNELIDDLCPADVATLCRAPYSWTAPAPTARPFVAASTAIPRPAGSPADVLQEIRDSLIIGGRSAFRRK